ncbi:hypothetical protein K469DRAFT_720135 [Zopfia rhizophila CBS 207.26]|uniref:F-box domain-containing protein n=1 Tax=Zopfia rhizophila CBS 207.26 TaxID=1314779 RepID=A0A6A6EJG4_9PEZI|nr:hypothetical protein K469DRAFT_720135 [Zopfia rhizophila CBS 207.26]
MPYPPFPVEIWLLIVASIDEDANYLWSTCRQVSRAFRAVVDDLFRHILINKTFVELHYTDVYRTNWPQFHHLRVPLVFDRFSDDGSRAYFQQRVYKRFREAEHINGSIRHWIPFIERYHDETKQPRPLVLSRPNIYEQGVAAWWEESYTLWDRSSSKWERIDHTSIGRGNRPPYMIVVCGVVNDTELVDLQIDCRMRELSFDWRQTYTAFFREQEFLRRAHLNDGRKKMHDEDAEAMVMDPPSSLKQISWHRPPDYYPNDMARCRHKRLAQWTAENKYRVPTDVRLITERYVGHDKKSVLMLLRQDNLLPVTE